VGKTNFTTFGFPLEKFGKTLLWTPLEKAHVCDYGKQACCVVVMYFNLIPHCGAVYLVSLIRSG